MTREAYPSDVSDDEWAFVALYLTLMKEDAPQREYALRKVFNGLRYIARTGMQWRMMPNDLPAVAHCVSTDATVAAGGRLRRHGA